MGLSVSEFRTRIHEDVDDGALNDEFNETEVSISPPLPQDPGAKRLRKTDRWSAVVRIKVWQAFIRALLVLAWIITLAVGVPLLLQAQRAAFLSFRFPFLLGRNAPTGVHVRLLVFHFKLGCDGSRDVLLLALCERASLY